MNERRALALGGLVLLALFVVRGEQAPAPDGPRKPVPVKPAPRRPAPAPKPCPGPGPCPSPSPWDARGGPVGPNVGAKVGGNVAPDGQTEIHCDLPGELHQKNTGGSDGAGLCVFASMRHSGRYQNDPLFAACFEWMKKHPGGGYPEKVDRVLQQASKELGLPVPDYIQVEGGDLEVLKLACRTGRMPGVTYCKSPTGRYGGSTIAHMVSLPHADDQWFCVLDNNYPGEDAYEWMTPQEFSRTYTGGGGGWSVILLTAPPPPAPHN